MKNCSTIFAFLFAALIFGNSALSLSAEELKATKYPAIEASAKTTNLSPDRAVMPKNAIQKQASVNFLIFDSLANVYSYGSMMANKAIKYDAKYNAIVTVKRGFYDQDRYPTYAGDNTKNNLFLRVSYNWGKNWDPVVKMYDKSNSALNEARYPSAATFDFGNALAVAYNSPRVIEKNGDDWPGHIIGFWNDEYGPIAIGHPLSMKIDPSLKWGTESRVFAGSTHDGAGFYHYTVCRAQPIDIGNVEFANGFGWKRSVDMSNDLTEVIPPQWASSNFNTTEPKYITSSMVDLKKDAAGNFYFAVFGGFKGFYSSKNSFGVSKSTDEGTTWTEFNIMPWEVANNYIISKGHPSDSAAFIHDNKGFVVLDNGDYSFGAKVLAYGNGTTEAYMIEIAYSQANNAWRIIEINDNLIGTGTFNYRDIFDSNNNPDNWNDHELDIVRTVDGKHLLAKWIDITGYDEAAGTFTGTDVYIATRTIGQENWSEVQNVTNSDAELDRMTLLPDLIPNNLIDIPLFKMVTMSAAGASPQTIYDDQFYGGKDQYLVVGHINAVVGVVEEENCDSCKLQIQLIQPNPISGDGAITIIVYFPTESRADFSIYDSNGKLVNDMKNEDAKVFGMGQNIIEIDFTNNVLPIGSYYLNVVSNGQKVTKMFSVIR